MLSALLELGESLGALTAESWNYRLDVGEYGQDCSHAGIILTRRAIMHHPASTKLMMYPGTDSKIRYTISCFTYVCTTFTARVGNGVPVG